MAVQVFNAGHSEVTSANPFGDFRKECKKTLETSLAELYPDVHIDTFSFEIPPSPEFGQLASPVFFELGKTIRGVQGKKLTERIVEAVEVNDFPLIREVRAAGGGYVNFYADFAQLSKTTVDSVRALDSTYGYVKTEKPKRIIVEHTSANPISPIHIGQARNPVLGDALARILSARGHRVLRHFYVDDVGRQTAVIAYGYEKLGEPSPEGKADHFVGRLYAITSCIIEISRLKKSIEDSGKKDREEADELQGRLEEWESIADELKSKHPGLFAQLSEKLSDVEDLESTVSVLNQAYEAGERRARKLVREVCQLSLEGIRETLANAGIFFDSWDWESDFAWNGDVAKTLEELKQTGYVFHEGPVLEFDANRVAEDLKLKQRLGMKKDHEIPSLTLVRADGTTLYTTRDIPYSVWKFKKAERVINVVGIEQTLPQQQLRLALWALGHTKQAQNLTHFAHNMITLPGYRMSGRRGRYITFDEVMDEALSRALEEVEKRSPQLSDEEKKEISRIVGIGALKYALVEVDPIKPVVFTWDRVINFERNSAPYIQYSHARARSILRKAQEALEKPDYPLLAEPIEHDLILALARFPEVFINTAENLKPNGIADFADALADKFNSFYNSLPVIKAKPKGLRDARLGLVEAVTIVLRNSLSLIGIVAPERM